MTNSNQWKKHIEDSKDIFFKCHSDLFRAFEFSRHYSVFYDALIRSLVTEASREVFGTENPQGVAVYSFGAPSRREMFGGSDADVAFYRAEKSKKELELRDCVVKALQDYDFTKVDTPVWGTLDEVERYMKTSVTESNQVMEASYICGDPAFREKVEQVRNNLYDPDLIARNLTFQFFYFKQYFGKKSSPDHLNLKYCDGGIRDFLFPMWYAQLKKGIARDLRTTTMERGLNILYEEQLLSAKEVADILSNASALAYVRDEVIRLTPEDMDGKLNSRTAVALHRQRPHLFESPQAIVNLVAKARGKTKYAKEQIWEGLCRYFADTKSSSWNEHFKKALAGKTAELPPELEYDEVINTARIWNLDGQKAQESGDYLRKISDSDSWIVLASILSNPNISGDVIHAVIRRRGLTSGYEYFQEIAARNPNLQNDTLEFILADTTTEPRFKKPALKLAKERGI